MARRVSEGGVDITTGATTGAIAGAVLGASGGPIGLVAGAVIGAAIGGVAAAGREHPPYPDYWEEHRNELHEDNREERGAEDESGPV